MTDNYKIKEVTSLQEFVTFVLRAKKDISEWNIYYRGENTYFEHRLPSFYRDTFLLLHSERYYRTLMNEIGWEDYSDNVTLVRRMAELQHYGAKTRILDVTSNPLVALYFAVENATKEDEVKKNQDDSLAGYIYFYKENPNEEKFDTGHTVAIKTAINLMPSDKVDTFCNVMSVLSSVYQNGGLMYLHFTIEDWIDVLRKSLTKGSEFNWNIVINDSLLSVVLEHNGKILKQEFPLLIHLRDYRQEYITKFNSLDVNLQELMCYIFEQTINNFLELLNQRAKTKERLIYPMSIFLDLIRPHIVLPSKNTDRLKQQQGAFIYPGIHNVAVLEHDINIISRSINEKATTLEEVSKIKISPMNKMTIKKELAILGITSGFIYPDLQHLADSVLEKIKYENFNIN